EVDAWLIKQKKLCPVCKYDVTNPPTALVPATASPTLSTVLVAEAANAGRAGSRSSSASSRSGTGVRPSIYADEDTEENQNPRQSPTSVVSASRTDDRQSNSGTIVQPQAVTAAQMLANVDAVDRNRNRTNGAGGSIFSRILGTRGWPFAGRLPSRGSEAALREGGAQDGTGP
ncbi:hypothetical protein FRC17_004438, partial [Serendipita sp. 399]